MATLSDYVSQSNPRMNQSVGAQPAIPRAMEAQAFAVKRLIEVAHELQSRLAPVMSAELPSAVGGGSSDPAGSAPCGLSEQIEGSTVELNQAANVLRSILRRLAL